MARHAAVGPRMGLYRAVESRPVMAAGMMTRECVEREIIRAGVSGRRSRRRRHRPTHTLPSTRASRETTWQQELASLHSERPDWDNRTRTGPAPGWRPLWFPFGLKSFFGLYPESCRFLIYSAPAPTGACANAGVAAVADSSTAAARALNEIIFVSPVWIDCRSAWDETN